MALPTIVKATLQTAFLNALSNVIAQVIIAQKSHASPPKHPFLRSLPKTNTLPRPPSP